MLYSKLFSNTNLNFRSTSNLNLILTLSAKKLKTLLKNKQFKQHFVIGT